MYQPPQFRYNAVYHPEYLHWTPESGIHTHGHYDLVPHVTPGHFDIYGTQNVGVGSWFIGF